MILVPSGLELHGGEVLGPDEREAPAGPLRLRDRVGEERLGFVGPHDEVQLEAPGCPDAGTTEREGRADRSEPREPGRREVHVLGEAVRPVDAHGEPADESDRDPLAACRLGRLLDRGEGDVRIDEVEGRGSSSPGWFPADVHGSTPRRRRKGGIGCLAPGEPTPRTDVPHGAIDRAGPWIPI